MNIQILILNGIMVTKVIIGVITMVRIVMVMGLEIHPI